MIGTEEDADVLVLNEKRVGRYLLLDPLGGGAMGEVWRAEDPDIGRAVAVKILDIPRSLEPRRRQEWEQRFVVEARAAGSLAHPGIAAIYDVGKTDEGRPFIVMEYVEGRGLDAIIESEERLPVETVLEWGAQIAEALDEAHRRGVVHRDVKPGNILVGADGRPRLVDFGIAQIEQSEVTRDGTFLGTPAFTSPEQFRGETADGRSDIFALGAVLYALLAGARPFSGHDLATLSWQICHSDPMALDAAAPWISRRVASVIGKALCRDRAGRHQTGRELARDLRAARAEPRGASSAERSAIAERTWRPGVDRRGPLGWWPLASKKEAPSRRAILTVIGSLSALAGFVALAGWLSLEDTGTGKTPQAAQVVAAGSGTPARTAGPAVSEPGKVAGGAAAESEVPSRRVSSANVPSSASSRANTSGPSAKPAVQSPTTGSPRGEQAAATDAARSTAPHTVAPAGADGVVGLPGSESEDSEAQTAGAKAIVAAPRPVNPAVLRVEVRHGLPDGHLKIWSNGVLVLDADLSAAVKRKGIGKVLPKRGVAVFPVHLAAGRQSVRVEVTSGEKDFRIVRAIDGTLAPGAHEWLDVQVKNWPEPKLSLDWEAVKPTRPTRSNS